MKVRRSYFTRAPPRDVEYPGGSLSFKTVFEKCIQSSDVAAVLNIPLTILLPSDALTGFFPPRPRTMGHLEMVDAVKWYLLTEVFASFLSTGRVSFSAAVFFLSSDSARFYPGH